jgi:hypothetical protein
MATELDLRMQLRESRLRLRAEMRKASSCIKKEEKIALVNEWKSRYSERHVRELIACAKTDCRHAIANWKTEEL